MSDSHTPEAALLRSLLLVSSKLGATVFRNQVGQYRLAKPGCMECQRFGRIIRSGLAVGSSDLIGWLPVTITPAHVGKRLAVFVGVEAKAEDGRLRPEQKAFLAALQRAGAVCGVARSIDDLSLILKGQFDGSYLL